MSSNSSGKKLEGFFTGKGFYIVLFLCAAVIGVSAWMMAAGDVAMKNEVPVRSNVNMENKRVETVIIPAETAAPAAEAPVFGEAEPVTGGDEEIAAEAPEISAEGINAPVSELEDIVWQLRDENDLEKSAALDKRLHYLIGEAAGNQLIMVILRAMSETVDSFISHMREKMMLDEGYRKRLQDTHQGIVLALQDRNGVEAARMMREHFHVVDSAMVDLF